MPDFDREMQHVSIAQDAIKALDPTFASDLADAQVAVTTGTQKALNTAMNDVHASILTTLSSAFTTSV